MNLIQQGYYQLKISGFSAATELFSRALTEKEDADAYIGLLLADKCLTDEEQLKTLPKPLTEYPNFNCALVCANEQTKQRLISALEEQKPLLARKQEKYEQLKSGAGEKEISDEKLSDLLALARELKNFEDAPQIREALEKECAERQKAKDQKKKKKRMIVLPIVIVAALALLIAGFFFALPKRGALRYALTLNGYVVISCDDDATNVTVEEEIFGIKVTEIGRKSFKDCKKLETVTLTPNVHKIGRAAFNGCTALKSVNGSENVDFVDENAFKECTALRELHFASDCSIEKNAFRDCDADLKVYVGESKWTRIDDDD